MKLISRIPLSCCVLSALVPGCFPCRLTLMKTRIADVLVCSGGAGGYYQALATGIYKRYGLDVSIQSGGPQINGMQLLLSKRADVIIGYDLQLLESVQRVFRPKPSRLRSSSTRRVC
ncbi:Uncharacterised protein [Raoultella terrigena]|uniref:Uncharacterized protein n=1 Tax=Raoultella terrigena TaxID=577 RepID=A0A4U9D3I0_RAOTE|nr:Uncharacterised protein [Raoultella terrigena]